jgi:hypothetical protein
MLRQASVGSFVYVLMKLFQRFLAQYVTFPACIQNPATCNALTPLLDQTARTYCREVFEILRTLKQTRDMSVNEVKLIVSIEDPRTRVGQQGPGAVCQVGGRKGFMDTETHMSL